MYHEENLYFFEVIKSSQTFSSYFAIFNMITGTFLVERRGTLKRARRYACKNLLNFDCQNSAYFCIFQVAYK